MYMQQLELFEPDFRARRVMEHHRALGDALYFASVGCSRPDAEGRTAFLKEADSALDSCGSFINEGIEPGSPSETLRCFLIRHGWHLYANARHLFGNYLAAGFLPLDDLIPATGPSDLEEVDGTAHPLEIAVRSGSLDTVRCLLEHRCNLQAVPSRPWTGVPAIRPGVRIVDALSFVEAAAPSSSLARGMTRLLESALPLGAT